MNISVFYQHVAEASKQTGIAMEELLKKVHSFGIDGLEMDMGDVKDTAVMCNRLQKAGLKVESIYGFYNFADNPDGTLGFKQVDMAVALKANKIMIIPGFYKGSNEEDLENDRRNMLKAIEQICQYAKFKNITVCIEDFDDEKSPIADSKGMLWFLRQLPELKVTFDTGNFMHMCEDELEAFDQLKDRIVHVHCKDRSLQMVEGEEPKINMEGIPMYASPTGYGCIHMKEIIEKLKTMNYQGGLSIEHFGALDQLGYMEKSAMWIKSQL